MDNARTCQNLANGGREYELPTQTCAGVVVINTAIYAGMTFASYELAKHGHRKAAVSLQWLGAASDAGSVIYSYTGTARHPCAANWPCN